MTKIHLPKITCLTLLLGFAVVFGACLTGSEESEGHRIFSTRPAGVWSTETNKGFVVVDDTLLFTIDGRDVTLGDYLNQETLEIRVVQERMRVALADAQCSRKKILNEDAIHSMDNECINKSMSYYSHRLETEEHHGIVATTVLSLVLEPSLFENVVASELINTADEMEFYEALGNHRMMAEPIYDMLRAAILSTDIRGYDVDYFRPPTVEELLALFEDLVAWQAEC